MVIDSGFEDQIERCLNIGVQAFIVTLHEQKLGMKCYVMVKAHKLGRCRECDECILIRAGQLLGKVDSQRPGDIMTGHIRIADTITHRAGAIHDDKHGLVGIERIGQGFPLGLERLIDMTLNSIHVHVRMYDLIGIQYAGVNLCFTGLDI